jgi:hypothetical protein
MAGPSPICRTCIVSIFAAGVLALAGCGSNATPGEEEPDATASGGGSPGAGGSTAGTGGGKVGGSTGTGGTTTGGGGSTGAGGSTSGGTGGSTTGPCTPGTTPLTFDNIGTNNASYAGSGAPDTITSNGVYAAMSTSDCPLDPDMANAQPWADKIFNGCLDVCGDTNLAGHGKATLVEWNHSTGWATVQIASNLHWTGMWAPTTGSQPTTLVFWVKGAVGCEQDKFTIAIHAHGGNTNSPAMKVPIAISQQWQRVVIPWTSLKVLTSGNPDAITFVPSATGKVSILIDQAYLSKSIPPP